MTDKCVRLFHLLLFIMYTKPVNIFYHCYFNVYGVKERVMCRSFFQSKTLRKNYVVRAIRFMHCYAFHVGKQSEFISVKSTIERKRFLVC